MEQDYHEKICILECEMERYRKEKSELEDTYIEELSRLEKEKEDAGILLFRSQEEIRRLEKSSRAFSPELLLNIKDSSRKPEEKLVHESSHEVGRKQRLFMMKLARFEKVHHIIWSENTISKPPTRLADIKSS